MKKLIKLLSLLLLFSCSESEMQNQNNSLNNDILSNDVNLMKSIFEKFDGKEYQLKFKAN